MQGNNTSVKKGKSAAQPQPPPQREIFGNHWKCKTTHTASTIEKIRDLHWDTALLHWFASMFRRILPQPFSPQSYVVVPKRAKPSYWSCCCKCSNECIFCNSGWYHTGCIPYLVCRRLFQFRLWTIFDIKSKISSRFRCPATSYRIFFYS